jgi:hypothetical protein
MASDPNTDLIRRMIEARTAYERLCGEPPTCVHVSGSLMAKLALRGFNTGSLIAGMKVIARWDNAADEAICSRDEHLFPQPAIDLPIAKKAKRK